LRVLVRYSYGMYIVHKPLQHGITVMLLPLLGADALQSTPANVIYFIVGLASSLVLAALSYHVFERRFLALKSRVG
jgi:peptidoglycan/LPS O-acetylase OafA/YrhL